MAGFGPDLQGCFHYDGAPKKLNDLCNFSNFSKMTANFKLQVYHFHFSETITLNLLD